MVPVCMLDQARTKFQKEVNSGAISLVVGSLLETSREPMYGYEIAKALESHADGDLPMNQAAIYPVLRSLEKQGMLESEMKPSNSGPPRKYYWLTQDGLKTLAAWKLIWKQSKSFVDSVLETVDEQSSRRRKRGKRDEGTANASANVSKKPRTRGEASGRRRS